MKICFRATIRLFLLLSASFLLYHPVSSLLRAVYSSLSLHFETVFPIYNPIIEGDMYLEFERNLSFCTAAVIFFFFSLISSVFDNERYEYMIKQTEGFYKIRDGFRIYYPRYASADAVSAIISHIPLFLLTLLVFPKTEIRLLLQLEEWVNGFLIAHSAFTDKFGFPFGFAVAALILLCAKIPASILGLRRWRGLWLSDVEN